jgi:ABC-2 type transport system ATP-binding protein
LSKATYSIEARHLTKFFGRSAAIRDVSFTVNPGEVVGFLGPNGAGKSTTLRILSGLMRADKGVAFIDGLSIARDPEKVKERIGYMPENNPLPEDLRVKEYLHFRARLKGLPSREIRSRVEEVMEHCDLARQARRKLIGSLSKGYRQRVGVADAILSKPAVTIMDEPTIGLDPHQILQIRKLIDSMRGETTVILSSHILAEVELSCDRVLILNQGHIVASGSPAELRKEFFQQPHYVAAIAGEGNVLESALSALPAEFERTLGEPDAKGFRLLTLKGRDEADQSEALLRTLTHTDGLRVKRFERKVPTLEDIFLAATRRSWEEEHPKLPGSPTSSPKTKTAPADPAPPPPPAST